MLYFSFLPGLSACMCTLKTKFSHALLTMFISALFISYVHSVSSMPLNIIWGHHVKWLYHRPLQKFFCHWTYDSDIYHNHSVHKFVHWPLLGFQKNSLGKMLGKHPAIIKVWTVTFFVCFILFIIILVVVLGFTA